MKEILINKVAEALEGDLTEDSRRELMEHLLSDPEAFQLLSLLSAPELQVENNYPLPFETPATLFVGCSQGFLLPLASEGVAFSASTRKLGSRLQSLLGVEKYRLVASQLDFRDESQGGSTPLHLNLRADRQDGCSYIGIPSSALEKRNLEFWQSGSLVLKAPAKVLAGSPPFRIKPGLAVDIRVSDADEGVRILVVDTEFTPSEWRSAFVSLCLAGDLGEAGRLLGTQFKSQDGPENLLARIERQIQAIGVVTRTDGLFLQPSPATRSGSLALNELHSVYRLIWNGIVHYWPAAAEVPNPWPEISSVALPGDKIESALGLEARALAEACLRAANGDPVPDEGQPADSHDPRLRDGWVALLGWKALLSRQYEKARRLFASTEPNEEDPFFLGMTQALAEHLERCGSNGGKEDESSNDNVWRKVLSSDF